MAGDFFPFFFNLPCINCVIGTEKHIFSMPQFFIYKMEIICIIYLHRSREKSAQIYTPRF